MNLNDHPQQASQQEGFTIAGKTYRSRLLVGSGKCRDASDSEAAAQKFSLLYR
jgi:thiazole synthase